VIVARSSVLWVLEPVKHEAPIEAGEVALVLLVDKYSY